MYKTSYPSTLEKLENNPGFGSDAYFLDEKKTVPIIRVRFVPGGFLIRSLRHVRGIPPDAPRRRLLRTLITPMSLWPVETLRDPNLISAHRQFATSEKPRRPPRQRPRENSKVHGPL